MKEKNIPLWTRLSNKQNCCKHIVELELENLQTDSEKKNRRKETTFTFISNI